MLPRHLIAAFVNSVEFIDVITFRGAALTTVLIRGGGRQAKTRGFKRRGVVGNRDGGGGGGGRSTEAEFDLIGG